MRALEICEDLSDDEAKDLLGLSSRQLNMLRRILKDGSKRASDFPYDAKHNLKRLVERGFLIRTIEGIDAEKLKRMRDEGLTNMEIADRSLPYNLAVLDKQAEPRKARSGRLHKLDELSEPPNQTAEKEWTHTQ